MIPILEGKRIDLNMTPKEAIISPEIRTHEDHERLKKQIASHENMAFPFVDVFDRGAALAWITFDERGSTSYVDRLSAEDQAKLGISDNMLFDAIEEFGGSLNRNGRYPINSEIKYKLAELL